MENFSLTNLFFLVFSVLVILQLQPVVLEVYAQNVAQNHLEKPSISKMLMDTISLLRRSCKSSWEQIKAVIHDMQKQFSPLNLEGVEETETELGIGGVKGTIKEAVGNGKSKDAVEESAKSAANVVREAVDKTAGKVTNEESEAEL